MPDPSPLVIAVIAAVVLLFVPLLVAAVVSAFLTTVPAGTIRIVSWYKTPWPRIYKGPGKAVEVPLLTTAATIPSQAINIDLDITDQTADRDASGVPNPIKVRVQASAIVAVGDTDEMILTAANRFFAKPVDEQLSTITDLLTSAGRRAINLLQHDQLFSAARTEDVADEDEDPLAVIIKRQCSRELHDLGLTFKSLNIKVVNSEVAEARRRQTAMEAKANADIVQAEQERRAEEAKLAARGAISDKERELAVRRAENAARVAEAEALRLDALAVQRTAELRSSEIAQATADAERARIDAVGHAEAEKCRLITVAEGEAERVRIVAAAQAEAIARVGEAMAHGGEGWMRVRQLELLPMVAPEIARALAQAKLVHISSGDAPGEATAQIAGVVQAVLTAQLVRDVTPAQLT